MGVFGSFYNYFAQDKTRVPMIWTVDPSLGSGNNFQLPFRSGFNYDVRVQDGINDVHITSWNQAETFLTYPDDSPRTITFTGTVEAIYFNNGGDKLKLVSVNQFGDPGLIACNAAFYGCANATYFSGDNLDTFVHCSLWNDIFRESGIITIPTYNTINILQFTNAFDGCGDFEIFPQFIMSSATSTAIMCRNCVKLISIPELDWGNNLSSVQTFRGCVSLVELQNAGSWAIPVLINADRMLEGVTLVTENYTSLLIGWENQPHQPNVTFDGGNSKYCSTAVAARAVLVADGWTITDGDLDPACTTIKNGYLYNWPALSDANFGITDWELPSLADYDALITELGGSSLAGGAMKETGEVFWTGNVGATNSSGFTGYGAGMRNGSTGLFEQLKASLFLATSGSGGGTMSLKKLQYFTALIAEVTTLKEGGVSSRLIYTGAGTPAATITDPDGKTYDVIQIGSQYWTVQNWASTKLSDNTPIPEVTGNTAWAALTTMGRCAYDNDENNV